MTPTGAYTQSLLFLLCDIDYLNNRYAFFPFHDYTITVWTRGGQRFAWFRTHKYHTKVGRIAEYLTPTESVTKL